MSRTANLSSAIYNVEKMVAECLNTEVSDAPVVEKLHLRVQTVRSSKLKLHFKNLDKWSKGKKKKEGKTYPIDLWFLLSEYIEPETIGKFARICKGSHYVTTTPVFWLRLQQKMVKSFPPDVQDSLELPSFCTSPPFVQLRSYVIQQLYITHFDEIQHLRFSTIWNFRARLEMNYIWPIVIKKKNPKSLIGMKCIFMWHFPISRSVQGKNEKRWQYFLKLERAPYKFYRMPRLPFPQKSDKSLSGIDKRQSDCRIIKISCLNAMEPESIEGLLLHDVVITNTVLQINRGYPFVHCKIHLRFRKPKSRHYSEEMTFLHVEEFRIIDWWDADYVNLY